MFIWKHMYKDELKSLYDDIISVVDDVFDQWDPSTATLEEAHLIPFHESIMVSL